MQLLEHIHNLTLNPKNAARLKELVLELAVRGKLTVEWRREHPDVESANILLEHIQEEKERLVEEKKIKNEKPLTPFADENIPYELPEGWEWCRLGDISTLINGDRGKNYPSKANYVEEGIPFITAGNIKNSSIDETSLNFITEERFNLLRSGHIRKNDILYCLRGSLGKCAIAENLEAGAIASSLVIIRLFSYTSNIFILNCLKGPLGALMVNRFDNGTAQPNLSASNVKEYLLPLPPLAEQQAIVEIVDQLMRQIEELEQQTMQRIEVNQKLGAASLHQLTNAADDEAFQQHYAFIREHVPLLFDNVENIKKLRESILQLAVQGRLTATWRRQNLNVEPASVLLNRIMKEKERLIKEEKIKKENPMPPIAEEDIPYELPEGWEWCRMQEIGLLQRGKSKHRPRNDVKLFKNGHYPLVQTGDVSTAKKNGGIINTHGSEYNDFGLAQSKIWPSGTLCITIAANIAETGFLGYDSCFPDSVVGFTSLDDEVLSKYVQIFISVTKSDLERYAPSTAQKNINLGILYELKFPLPPLTEQQAIVSIVEQLMQFCDALEKQIAVSKEKEENLMQAIIHHALEGKEEVPVAV